MRKLLTVACGVALLTGCEVVDTLEQIGVRQSPSVQQRPVARVEASCHTFTVTFTGWPENTYAIFGVGNTNGAIWTQGTHDVDVDRLGSARDADGTYGYSLSVIENGVPNGDYLVGGTEASLLGGISTAC